MKRNTLAVMTITALILPLLVMAAPGGNSRTSGRTDRTGRTAAPAADSAYQTITTRNIFISDRTVKTRPPIIDYGPRIERIPVPQRPEKVLTGIALQGDYPVAFFEDPQTGETIRVAAGGSLDDGTVTSVEFEGVTYRTSKGTRQVHVGETISGVAASLYSPPMESPVSPVATPAGLPALAATATQPAATSSPAALEPSTAPAVSTENMSIEERMRLRRLKEQ